MAEEIMKAKTEFVHLHIHSDYSLCDSTASIKALVDRAEELGMKHLALTDRGNMFGIMDFIEACKNRQNPIKPIIGCELYVTPGSHFEKKGNEKDNRHYHLVLLAENRQGYLNLIKLCSLAYIEGFYFRPRIDDKLLSQHHEGLIALSGCVQGEIPWLIRAGKFNEAEQKAIFYNNLFGKDNFYLEIQDQGIPAEWLGYSISQKKINKTIIEISRNTGIPLVATNDVHYIKQEDNAAYDVLLCIGTKKQRIDKNRKKCYGDQFYFKTSDEMAALFNEHPEAIANTVCIAERCDIDIPNIKFLDIPRYFPDCLPDIEIPKSFENAASYLKSITFEGLAGRYSKEKQTEEKSWDNIVKRAVYELDFISQMGFENYFLIVADYVNWAREHNIPVGHGRGSSPGSIVTYALHITNIDPIKYGLLFERFNNPECISIPAIDIDFGNKGRDEVINYVTEKYGKEYVGRIITFGNFGTRAVIKDVARVLGISFCEAEMITKLIPPYQADLKSVFDKKPELWEMEQNPIYTELFTIARKLEGLHRHASFHPTEIVISKSVLNNLVPLYRKPKYDEIAIQYGINHLEGCGLVKFDFLGLKTLDVIKNTEELIRYRGGELAQFNIENITEDDKVTFNMLSEGQSFGVFQFESEGMQDILRQAKPQTLTDLMTLNSLYRPGLRVYIGQFIDSKNGKTSIIYPDPCLEDILKETYGVIVYQEQIIQIIQRITGCSLGKADNLRHIMEKNNKESVEKEKYSFLESAIKHGSSAEKSGSIFAKLVSLSGYAFNKSHAAAYAKLAYQAAYLKANFPSEFITANINNAIHSPDKYEILECIAEARKMGLTVDLPDINLSDKFCTVVDKRIVYGFVGIRGIGEAVADEIVRCRKNAPYQNFFDFLIGIDTKIVGKASFEPLIKIGVFDSFGINRGTLLGNLDKLFAYVLRQKNEKHYYDTYLWRNSDENVFYNYVLNDFPEISLSEKLEFEKKFIGFYLSGHPLDEHRQLLS
jgi:DNA polymerase-3 subunit alpha